MSSDKSNATSRYFVAIGLILVGALVCFAAIKAPMVYEDSKSIEYSTSADKTTAEEITVSYPLNLNTATLEELMTIDGVGESTAGAIISYRENYKQFESVEELMNIKGIGEGKYQSIAPYVTV